MSANISWSIPYQILQDPTYDYINIYRGSDENDISSYKIINIIPRWRCDNKEWEIDSFCDQEGNEGYYYFVKYTDNNGKLSKMLLTVFDLTPKQQRWVNQLRQMLDPIITSSILADGTMRPMSDTDLMLGINMALDYFNNYSPITDFTFANFPKGGGYEFPILMFAQVFTIMGKYLGLSLRDFSYSDNGLSLNQSFSPALQTAIKQILDIVNPLIQKAKMDFSDGLAQGLGSTQWMVGTSGRVSWFSPQILGLVYNVTHGV